MFPNLAVHSRVHHIVVLLHKNICVHRNAGRGPSNNLPVGGIRDSKGPRYLAKKNFTTECAIVSILWDAGGLEPTPNDWNNLDFNNYPIRSRNMELCEYIKIQKEYLKVNKSVRDQL